MILILIKEIDFENLNWEKVQLHNGVYIAVIDDEPPLVTTHAIRIEKNSEVGLHYHKREKDWIETIYFVHGGCFEILSPSERKKYNTTNPVYLRINANEEYGIKNLSEQYMLFLASMKPSFSGFDEIENCHD